MKAILIGLAIGLLSFVLFAQGAIIQAASFSAPTQWSVGDLNSTYQQWENGGPSAPISHATTSFTSNPAIDDAPLLNWSEETGAYVATSGGLYSFSANYSITTQIHSFSPAGAAGTYLVVQTAGTVNPDYDPQGDATGGGVLRDSIKIYDSTHTLVRMSQPAEVTRTYYDPAYPLFGGVGYEQLIWQVFVPNLVGDFLVTADSMVHSSFQALRIDSFVSVPTATTGDFDADGDVDGADFIAWQIHFPTPTGASLAQGDADGDHDVDGADFAIWRSAFSPPAVAGAVTPIPEPQAGMLIVIGVFAAIAGYWAKSKCHFQSIERIHAS